jgi:hypothetical protein
MKLIDDWAATLKRSYTLWLTYIMTGCGLAIAAIHEAGADLLPDDWRSWAVRWLMRVIFACTLLQIPARVIKQPALPNK